MHYTGVGREGGDGASADEFLLAVLEWKKGKLHQPHMIKTETSGIHLWEASDLANVQHQHFFQGEVHFFLTKVDLMFSPAKYSSCVNLINLPHFRLQGERRWMRVSFVGFAKGQLSAIRMAKKKN